MPKPKQLREYRMLFERVPKGQKAIDRNALGQRSKLGGKPDWEQSDETPTCPGCGYDMTFVAQIDSIEQESKLNPHSVSALSPEQQYMFGDVGLLYVFFCLECSETETIFQCG